MLLVAARSFVQAFRELSFWERRSPPLWTDEDHIGRNHASTGEIVLSASIGRPFGPQLYVLDGKPPARASGIAGELYSPGLDCPRGYLNGLVLMRNVLCADPPMALP